MTVQVSPEEVKALLTLALRHFGIDPAFLSLVSIEGNQLVIRKGFLSGRATVAAVDGAVELDLDLPFGAISRPIAAKMILDRCKPYADKLTAWKAANGNLRFAVMGIHITRVMVSPGEIRLDGTL